MRRTAALAVLTTAVLTACGSATGTSTSTGPAGAAGTPDAPGVPALAVSTVVGGLEHPWDLGFLPDGSMLVTERAGRVQRVADGRAQPVSMDLDDVFAQGESGLLGLLVHPDFATSREFSTCQSHTENGDPVDIRVLTWTLSEDGSAATAAAQPLLTGLPLNPSGRHSGCRLGLDPDGNLMVTTGDTADPDAPQDLGSLGGKTLRADLETGKPLADPPFPADPYVWSTGHRNLQGIAVRPGTDQVFTAEHGPDIDDEVNLDARGANSGWDPSQGGTVDSYDESVPMTDLARFPDAVEAVWSSGDPTEAISGAAFLDGPQWGSLDGAFVMAALKGQKVIALQLDAAGAVTGEVVPAELRGTLGRIRSVQQGPDGDLYLTTDNGSDDEVVRVTPTG